MQLFEEPEPPKTYLTDNQKLAWLRLIRSENVGPATFKRLINRYGNVDAALGALPALAARGGAAKPIKICLKTKRCAKLKTCIKSGVNSSRWANQTFLPCSLTRQARHPFFQCWGRRAWT